MSRGIGALEPVQNAIPEWMAVLLALLTQLGDVWFLGLVLTVLYWSDAANRDDVAAVAGLWLAGMGMYKGLKEVFGFPRPEQPLLDADLLPWVIRPLYEATAMASGYGFPSGHAVGTTVVYFGLASVLTVSTRRRRFAAAGTLVAVVCFTRLALGVHYLVDVVAGVAFGLLLLGGAWGLANRRLADRTTISFGLAVAFGAFFLAVTAADPDAIFVLAASLGAFAGWQLVALGRQLVLLSRPSRAVRPILVRGGAAALALAPIVAAFELFPLVATFEYVPLVGAYGYVPVPSKYAAGGAVGLVSAAIVTVPVMRGSERAERVAIALWFWIRMSALGVRHLLSPRTWRRGAALARVYAIRVREWVRTRQES